MARAHEPVSWTQVGLLIAAMAVTAAAQDYERIDRNERAAIGALKTIATSQAMFREGDKDQNNEFDYAPNLQALADTSLIDKVLGSGTKYGYRFKVTTSPKSPEFLWMATATPIKPGVTGERSFAINQAGVIYHSLEPFAHNAACKLTGTPVGKPLPGWARKRSKPEGPWGEAVRKAAADEATQRWLRGRKTYVTADGRLIEARVRFRGGGRLELEVVRADPKTQVVRVVTSDCDDQGRLWWLKIEQLKFPERRPKLVRHARRHEGKIELRAGGEDAKPRVLSWKPNTITRDLALFLLPQLAEHLPATLTLNLALEGEPQEGALKVTVAKTADGKQRTVTLTHPKLGTATLKVQANDDRATQTWKGFDGAAWRATTPEEARQLFLSKLPASSKLRKQLQGARRHGNEAAAIGALKMLSTAQSLFREADKDQNGELDYAPDLAALGKTNLIDAVLAKGVKHGYRFELIRSSKDPEFLWMATAAPVKPGTSGSRYFVTNHTGVIFYSEKPIALDPIKCQIPQGLKPVGR